MVSVTLWRCLSLSTDKVTKDSTTQSSFCDDLNMRSKTLMMLSKVVVLIPVNSHCCAVTLRQEIVDCGKQKTFLSKHSAALQCYTMICQLCACLFTTVFNTLTGFGSGNKQQNFTWGRGLCVVALSAPQPSAWACLFPSLQISIFRDALVFQWGEDWVLLKQLYHSWKFSFRRNKVNMKKKELKDISCANMT